MARLRVSASPTKSLKKAVVLVSTPTKDISKATEQVDFPRQQLPVKEPRKRSNVIANPCPAYNPQANGPISLGNGTYKSKVEFVPKPHLSTPIKGKVQVLATVNDEALSDIQGYVMGVCDAVVKNGQNEYINPALKMSVFFLQQDEPQEPPSPINSDTEDAFEEYINDEDEDSDRPWKGVIDFKKVVAKSNIKSCSVSDDTEDGLQDLSIIEEQDQEVDIQASDSPETPPGAHLMRTKTVGSRPRHGACETYTGRHRLRV
jgi:hypothetical protein